jgi:hypothetical protein
LFDLKKTLQTLKVKFGDKKIGKKLKTEYYSIPIEGRKEILRRLVIISRNKGQDENFFFPNSVRLTVAEWCFPDALTNSWTKDKRTRAYLAVFRELDDVVEEVFSKKYDTEEVQNDREEVEVAQSEKFVEKELDKISHASCPPPNSGIDEEMAVLLGLTND